MKLAEKTVAKTVMAWDILFGSKKTGPQMAVISAKFHLAFKGTFSEESWHIATGMVEKQCRFFPTIADMEATKNDVHAQVERNRPPVLMIAESSTRSEEEAAAMAVEQIASMRRMLVRKMGM